MNPEQKERNSQTDFMVDAPGAETDEELIIDVETIVRQLRSADPSDRKTEPISRIFPGLFVSGLEAAQNKGRLKDHAIEAVLSVLDFECDCKELYDKLGIRHLYLHTRDDGDFAIAKHFEPAYAFVMETIGAAGNVLVHCAAGMSRSVTVATYVLMRYLYQHDRRGVERYLRSPLDKDMATVADLAFAYVRLRRRVASPEPGFRRQLQEQEARWRRETKM